MFIFTKLDVRVSSTGKVLAYVGDIYSAVICEQVERLSAWTGEGEEVTHILQQVLVGGKTQRSSSGVKTEGIELKKACNEGKEGCGTEREAASKPHGIATLFRCTHSSVLIPKSSSVCCTNS